MLVDSDVYAAGTVDMMLEGKQFHRAVRGLTLAYEAVMQLFLIEFLNWCGIHERTIPLPVWLLLSTTLDAVEGTPGDDGLGIISNQSLEMSNVSVVEEMVAMIIGQRAYEANSKALQTGDSMLGIANGLKR